MLATMLLTRELISATIEGMEESEEGCETEKVGVGPGCPGKDATTLAGRDGTAVAIMFLM